MASTRPPDPSIHRDEPRFADLSHDAQVALAAWAVLLKSEPPADRSVIDLPPAGYGRAVGDIALTVGLRSRKRMNYGPQARHQRRRVRRRPVQRASA